MPTYDYECTDCGRRFEIFHGMTEEPRTECEVCKGRLKKLIGPGAGIIFKGSGFYCTDYRSDDYKQKASKESGGNKKSSSNDGNSKSETKSASSASTETAASTTKTAESGESK